MASFEIDFIRNKYPGMSDAEAASAFAQANEYIAVIRYGSSEAAVDFTNIGACKMESEIRGYLNSPYCHDAEIIYDGRNRGAQVVGRINSWYAEDSVLY